MADYEKRIIPHMGILVTTYCNLNCRDCADMIPKRKEYHYSLEEIKADFQTILNSVDLIEEVLIIGGEAYLYPELKDVIEYVGNCEKVNKIIITTNGTFLPKEDVMEAISHYDVTVRVSGYPKHVAPNREDIIGSYRNRGVRIEDLANMGWLSMGGIEKRGRDVDTLKKVFKSCSMKDCVTLARGGNIIFCSRQLSAIETDIYPAPDSGEYINIHKEENLYEALNNFYNIDYISTCDYCDGISAATTKVVPTAIQILPKTVFLQLLFTYMSWEHSAPSAAEIAELTNILNDYLQCFEGVEEIIPLINGLLDCLEGGGSSMQPEVIPALCNLINRLSDDYRYSWEDNAKDFIVGAAEYKKDRNVKNMITAGYGEDSNADLVFSSETELVDAWMRRNVTDLMTYHRFYIEAKFDKLRFEPVRCVVSGLSYTQYGIHEREMGINTVNLSVTSQDIAYSVLMAKRAIEINPNVECIVIPIAYYQPFYDMSASEAELHREVVSRVDIPILGEVRNYKAEGRPLYRKKPGLDVFEYLTDQLEAERYAIDLYTSLLKDKEFFNEFNPENATGGLRFDFKDLTEQERYASAKITAEHNCRCISKEGQSETEKYLMHFLEDEAIRNKKILFFAPPMTKYLSESYSQDLLAEYHEAIDLLMKYDNVTYVDLTNHADFYEDDFADFEHLNHMGGQKLTKIISELLERM